MLLLKRFSEWRRRALPKVNYGTVVQYYMPATGAIGHSLYTVHIFSPNILHSLFPLCDTAIEHSLLSTSNIGLGFYLFFLPQLKSLKVWDRVELSVLTTVLFNFGSFVAAIFLKALLPSKYVPSHF
uniref:Dolichyl-P-Glc:Glc(2)Man(9)GlcNAc(2)-PP-dolichol alpha-1,2-glucosyltransferase n=1 Tax=Syphacia muris TaxID=451379 RepID=A0A0N5ASZ3_9BILA